MAKIVQPSATSYDQVPYPSTSYQFAHPDSMATAAVLLGLNPAPVEHCRVLELGVAGGGNIIPMALALPESEFVGIDASGVQIADGQAALAAVGIKNVTLKHLNIMDVDASLGQFDYIIAHGIFSWVPEAVRDKLFAICDQNLAPSGIAYISYNVYPGWHMLGTVRDLMLYHTRNVIDPQMRVAQARAVLDFLAASTLAASHAGGGPLAQAYASFLKSERKHIVSSTDSYVYHEELEEVNDPLYFHQFAEWAARHGLQYLSEANFSDVFLNDFPSQVADTLLKLSHDLIEMEQYIDFLRNRTFRKTLLVHQGTPISRQLRPDRVANLYVSSMARPASAQPDLGSLSVEKFTCGDGAALSTDHPVSKAALVCLEKFWPRAVPFDTLLTMAYACLNQDRPAGDAPTEPDAARRAQDALVLGANLLKGFAYSGRLVELHVYAPRFVTEISAYPVASPWARFAAQSSVDVTNLCHTRLELKGLGQVLVSHLDGTLNRAALVEGLAKSLLDGALELKPRPSDGPEGGLPSASQPVTDIEQARKIVSEEVDETLRALARAALLVA